MSGVIARVKRLRFQFELVTGIGTLDPTEKLVFCIRSPKSTRCHSSSADTISILFWSLAAYNLYLFEIETYWSAYDLLRTIFVGSFLSGI